MTNGMSANFQDIAFDFASCAFGGTSHPVLETSDIRPSSQAAQVDIRAFELEVPLPYGAAPRRLRSPETSICQASGGSQGFWIGGFSPLTFLCGLCALARNKNHIFRGRIV